MTTTMPLVLHCLGRDLLARSPEGWARLVQEVGATLLTMPRSWRLITTARPARMEERVAALQDARALATTAQQRTQRDAEVLHLRDLAHSGVMTLDQYLLIWSEDADERRTLAQRLGPAWGVETVCSVLPDLLGGSYPPPASLREANPRGVLAADGSHAWCALVATRIHGQITPTLFREVLNRGFPVTVIWEVVTSDQRESRRRLDSARHRLEAHGMLMKEHSEERTAAMRDWQQASQLVQDGNLLHDLRCAVLVGGTTIAQAARHARAVSSALAGTIELRRATGCHQAVLPLATVRHPDAISMSGWPVATQTTPQLATLLPIYLSSHLGAGVLMGVDRMRNVPLWTDLDRLDARNAVICGWTGSGKSSYAATVLRRLIDHAGYQGIVIDPQGAFRPLAAHIAGARWMPITFRDGRMAVNPLDLIVDDLADPSSRLQQILHVVQVLGWLHGHPSFPPAAHTALETALDQLYTTIPSWAITVRSAVPRLRDLLATLDGMDSAGAAEMAEMVRRYVDGPYAVLLDQHTTLDLQLTPDTPLIVYDLADPSVPEQLRHLMMLLITSAVQRAVRTQPRKCVVVLDEAGVLFNDAAIAAFAENLAKTIRRFGGALWLIDQTLNLLHTKAGDEVFQNSAIVAVGSMQSDQRTTLEQRFPMLTDAQIQWATGIGLTDRERAQRRGNFLLMLNGAVYPIYNSLSSAEWQMIARSALHDSEKGHTHVA